MELWDRLAHQDLSGLLVPKVPMVLQVIQEELELKVSLVLLDYLEQLVLLVIKGGLDQQD